MDSFAPLPAPISPNSNSGRGFFKRMTRVSWIFAISAIALPLFSGGCKKDTVLKHTVLQPVQHIEGGTPLKDDELGFSVDLPPGFKVLPASEETKKYKHAYFLKTDRQTVRLVLVRTLGQKLERHLKSSDLPPGGEVSLSEVSWRGIDVDQSRVVEPDDKGKFITYNVVIPLKNGAVQFGFGARSTEEPQLRELVKQVLATLDGETDW